ncbi:MAG: hypothetical protein K8L99_15895 [Anaerolineae bacterium]|nr:hypothetical protein [Anaerolineae bacterium]
MLFAIKFVHSMVFVVVSLAIIYVWYAIFTGATGVLLALAVGAIVLESAVYVANGLRCPLTHLAQEYGDVSGDDLIADIFLPQWFVPLIPRVCGTLAVLGLLVLAVRVVLAG